MWVGPVRVSLGKQVSHPVGGQATWELGTVSTSVGGVGTAPGLGLGLWDAGPRHPCTQLVPR